MDSRYSDLCFSLVWEEMGSGVCGSPRTAWLVHWSGRGHKPQAEGHQQDGEDRRVEFVAGEPSASDPHKAKLASLAGASRAVPAGCPRCSPPRAAAAPFAGLAAPRPDLLPCPRRRDS